MSYFLVLLGLCTMINCSRAALLHVPGDYSSVTAALGAAQAGDTIWVHPGIYSERLIFPMHDVMLVSDYLMLNDESAMDSTIINASEYAGLDTAAVLTLVHGNTRATRIAGFTLTGGHGVLAPAGRWGGCIYLINSSAQIYSCKITANMADGGIAVYSDGGSSVVSHCEIYDNCGVSQLLSVFNQPDGPDALFEWNDIHDNRACEIGSQYMDGNGIVTNYGHLVVRFNHFHDYLGSGGIGVWMYDGHAEIYGNTFERISTDLAAMVVLSTRFSSPVTDNIFRDLDLGEASCVQIHQPGLLNHYPELIERNWFEDVTNSIGPSCLFMGPPNGEVRDNVFLCCQGHVGAVQLSQNSVEGCQVSFERNAFFYNRAVGVSDSNGSAFGTVGSGQPCTFTNNWFEGNEGWTTYFDYRIPNPDMSGNYWGDPSGPFHPTENPGGQGDSVPVNVHVTPWLTQPPGMSKSIEERLALSPEDWTLETAYPNPFNSTVHLRLTSAKPQPFEVTAYNTLGQRVSRVWQGVIPKDAPTLVSWNGTNDKQSNVASGIYYLVVTPKGPGARAPKSMKVVLLR